MTTVWLVLEFHRTILTDRRAFKSREKAIKYFRGRCAEMDDCTPIGKGEGMWAETEFTEFTMSLEPCPVE